MKTIHAIVFAIGLMSSVEAVSQEAPISSGPICQAAINQCSSGHYVEAGFSSPGECFDTLIGDANCPPPGDLESTPEYARWYTDFPNSGCASRLCNPGPIG